MEYLLWVSISTQLRNALSTHDPRYLRISFFLGVNLKSLKKGGWGLLCEDSRVACHLAAKECTKCTLCKSRIKISIPSHRREWNFWGWWW